MKVLNILDKIETLTGTNEKVNYLVKNMTPELDELLRIIFNEDIYNVSKKSLMKALEVDSLAGYEHLSDYMYDVKQDIDNYDNFSIHDIKDFLSTLKLTSGNAALDLITEHFDVYNNQQAKWMIRILLKDLRNGVKLKTINKVYTKLKKPLIKKFSLMLCKKIKAIDRKINEKDLQKLTYPVGADIKLDGARLYATKVNNKISLCSRNGKPFHSLPEVEELLLRIPADAFKVDTELTSIDYNTCMTRIHRKRDNINDIPLVVNIFDITELNGEDLTEYEFTERKTIITKIFEKTGNTIMDNVSMEEVVTEIMHTPEQVQEYFDKCLDEDYEGIVIKILNAPYIFDRSKFWIKIKPNATNEFKIIDCGYGTGKNHDVIASLTVQDASGKIQSRCGDLKEEQMEEFTRMHKDGALIGQIVEVKYDCISKERSLRFPTVVDIRWDKDEPDDLS